MIQWCEDCKHFIWTEQDEPSEEDMDFCKECLDKSKPGEQAIKWEGGKNEADSCDKRC